jgi:hypothetical protein
VCDAAGEKFLDLFFYFLGGISKVIFGASGCRRGHTGWREPPALCNLPRISVRWKYFAIGGVDAAYDRIQKIDLAICLIAFAR